MADPQIQLQERFSLAITAAFGAEHAGVDPLINSSQNPKFGDYQANVAMSLGKKLGKNPREVAAAIVDVLAVDELCAEVTVAGPGFINLRLRDDALAAAAAAMFSDARLGVQPAAQPQTVVVDYSSPNVAKEMHVGHLRSAIIGDAIVRVLELAGHKVIRQNHIGDWGTQFGMLIEHMVELGWELGGTQPIGDLNAMYQAAKKKDDADADFAKRARERVVKLQQGDIDTLAYWRDLIDESKKHFNTVYGRLGVLLTDDDICAESAYNDDLRSVIEALDAAGMLKESQGARVVYPEGFKDRDGNPQPMIVQKSDGGFLYATTDLAAARYRINQLHATRVIYVTDARQSDHFAMVFKTLAAAGWAADVRLDHVPFGTILGADRRPFKTRSGDTVRLIDLLEEAQQRAGRILDAKNPEMDAEARAAVAAVVAIGAMKYADLSVDRIKDYIFDWDRMLAMDGNTAPYLQNAYVRIRSIFRKGEIDPATCRPSDIVVKAPAEKALSLQLLQFSSVVASVAERLEPHRLCAFLYDLATAFHKFYEQCPVLIAEDAAEKQSRLALCHLTALTLKQGLSLLGIDTVEQM